MATLSWDHFAEVLNNWLSGQPTFIQERLRARYWRRLYQVGQQPDGTLHFDPDAVVSGILRGDTSLRGTIAVPLCTMLNATVASADRAPVKELEPAPASQIVQAPSESAPRREPSSPEPHQSEQTSPQPAAVPMPPPPPVPAAREEAATDPAPMAPTPASPPASPSAPATVWEYPQYDMSRIGETPTPLPKLTVNAYPDKLRYSWPDQEQGEVYRVITSDVEMPTSPEFGHEVGATTGTHIIDTNPATSPCRFITVWAYECFDPEDPFLGQCRLIAQHMYVYPLKDWELHFEDGAVQGRYSPPASPVASGLKVSVMVARLGEGQALSHALSSGLWEANLLPDSGDGLISGFTDYGVELGQRCTYIAVVRVDWNGMIGRTQPPQTLSIDITPGELLKVTDLEVEALVRESGNYCRLMWTRPSSDEVRIYRTTELPNQEAVGRKSLDVGQLASAGLPESARIKQPAVNMAGEDGKGKAELRQVEWFDGEEWDTLHFTPVTVRGNQATIGTPVTRRRSGGITEVVIRQRLEWALVAFDWPGEAKEVELRIGPRRTVPDVNTPAHRQVEANAYRKAGGFIIPDLPPEGCTLSLRAISYYEGKRIAGEPVVIDSPPIWTYWYQVEWPKAGLIGALGAIGRGLRSGHSGYQEIPLAKVTLHPYTAKALPEHPGFVLIHNHERLPLSVNDGNPVAVFMAPPSEEIPSPPQMTIFRASAQAPTEVYFSPKAVGSKGSYVRLFVYAQNASALPPEQSDFALERVGVIDPDLSQLKVR